MTTTMMNIMDDHLTNSTTTLQLESQVTAVPGFVYYCSYVFITFGTLCNIMAIICLYNKGNTANDKNNTVRYYLIVLAICDGLAIFWYSLHLILLGQKPPIHLQWETNCNFPVFVVGCTTELSSLMVMMITVNRFMAIFYPLKFKRLQSVRRIYKCIGILVLLVFIINWCSFGGLNRIDRLESHTIVYPEYQCRGRTSIIDDYYKVLPFIHSMVYLVIPGMVLFVLNIAIAMKLRQFRRVTVKCSNQENTLEGGLTNLQETQPPVKSGKDRLPGKKNLKENCLSRPHKSLQCDTFISHKCRALVLHLTQESSLTEHLMQESSHLTQKLSLVLHPTQESSLPLHLT